MNSQTRRQACSSTDKARERRLRIFAKVVEDAVFVYLMYAGIWAIGHIVSEIFVKLGVG